MTQRLATRRMMKELTDIQTKGCPDGIEALDVSGMDTWVFSIAVLGEETVYRGEKFALKMTFPERYPIECPIVYLFADREYQVTFVCDERFQPPLHPHVYSNGHICASIFGNDWSPVLTAISVCITIQSMLASNKKRARPEGNDRYVRNAPSNPKDTRWAYDDDTV